MLSQAVPYWQSECGRAVVYVGDCLEVMNRLAADQFHAIVTDPPYGLEFMGKEWDAPWRKCGEVGVADEGTDVSHPFRDGSARIVYGRSPAYQEWFAERAAEMLRLAKPGAHLLSFGGTRMWHRMACAIEDAGFDVRDTVAWVYGSGFPKGTDISKAIDRVLGVERTEVTGPGTRPLSQGQFNSREAGPGGYGYSAEYEMTAPATDQARQWAGWNTALKPAYEPILLARRPATGTVAQNVLDHGCGAINVDGCRVGSTGGTKAIPGSEPDYLNNVYGVGMGGNPKIKDYVAGRYPANLIHDGSEEVVESFPDGASRFFYTPKADADDRPHGKGATLHPTVKPLDLMCYLVRLVCAKGATVLDPFMGSGSTGCAAIEEGMWFVGIEQSQEYADIAVGRLRLALERCPQAVRLETGQVVQAKKATPRPPRKLRGS